MNGYFIQSWSDTAEYLKLHLFERSKGPSHLCANTFVETVLNTAAFFPAISNFLHMAFQLPVLSM